MSKRFRWLLQVGRFCARDEIDGNASSPRREAMTNSARADALRRRIALY